MSPANHYLNGVHFLQEGKYTEAISEFSQAIAEKGDAESLYSRAYVYLAASGNRVSEREAFDAYTRMAPTGEVQTFAAERSKLFWELD